MVVLSKWWFCLNGGGVVEIVVLSKWWCCLNCGVV